MEKKLTQVFALIKCNVLCIGILLLFQLFAISVHAQTTQVKGVVRDAKGETLPGVSVTVKGKANGTTTDNRGAFSINVPGPDAVLVFSSVGTLTKEETVGIRKVIDVSLAQSASNLDEVVVIGYGQAVRKRDVTGSISSVSSKQIEERQPVTLYDALQGQAAGVLIMNDNGEPGAQGSLRIRGSSTFTASGNTPLYVVDGVIVDDPTAISPNDIQSIEVLKDAASASIYGSRAAAGVVLITTKKGKEGKPRFDAQYTKVFGKLAHKIQEANASDLRYYRKEQAGNIFGTSGGFTDSLNPSFNTDNDLQQLLLGNTGNRDDIKLDISGGQKGSTFYGSINYINDKGIALNTWYKSIQSRINTEFQMSSKLKYSTNLSFYWSFGNFTSINNSLRPVFDRPSYSRIYFPDGTLTSYVNSKRNPVTNALMEDNTRENFKAQMNHQIDYQIIKDLKFTTAFNAQLTTFQGFYFQPRYLDANGVKNSATNDLNKFFRWQLQGFLNYNKKIGDHSIIALIGVEKLREINNYTHLEGHNFVIETVHYVQGAFMDNLTKQTTNGNAASTASAFGRLGYNYGDRYILMGSYRRDASSRFGPDNRIGNYLSGSAAWHFTTEKFMDPLSGVLSDGKIRLSWGQNGNDRVGYYDYMQLINQATNSYNGIASAALSTQFGNPTLQWEATEQKDAGIDLQFLKGKVSLTADYYIKTTHDLLYDRPLPAESGFSTVKVNVGAIETRGVEFQANVNPVTTRNFSWNISGNISFERGKILNLYNHQSFVTGKFYVQEGGRIGDFYGWKNLGVYQYDVSNAYDKNGNRLTPVDVVLSPDRKTIVSFGGYMLNGQKYSDSVYSKYANGAKLKGGATEWVDLNNDGVIDDADRMIIGNAQPDYYWGLVNNFTYKQFSLNVIINATVGGMVYNSFKQGLTNNSSSNGPALPEAIYGAWNLQGDIASYPYFPDKDNFGSQRPSGNSLFLEDASFVRLSSVRLSYRFKPSLTKKLFMNNASAYVYGINLLTWTNYTGYDPEFSSSNALQPGEDNGKYPKRREIGLGLNVSF